MGICKLFTFGCPAFWISTSIWKHTASVPSQIGFCLLNYLKVNHSYSTILVWIFQHIFLHNPDNIFYLRGFTSVQHYLMHIQKFLTISAIPSVFLLRSSEELWLYSWCYLFIATENITQNEPWMSQNFRWFRRFRHGQAEIFRVFYRLQLELLPRPWSPKGSLHLHSCWQKSLPLLVVE